MECLVFLSCPEDVMVQRILDRSKTSGRTDDNSDSIKKRITTFYSETLPVVDWFRTERNNVLEVCNTVIVIDFRWMAEEVRQRWPRILGRFFHVWV